MSFQGIFKIYHDTNFSSFFRNVLSDINDSTGLAKTLIAHIRQHKDVDEHKITTGLTNFISNQQV